MAADPAVWRCPVCEGVNRGGRVCATCGETLPDGFVPESAAPRPVRSDGPTRVVPPAPRPRAPTPEEVFGSNPFR